MSTLVNALACNHGGSLILLKEYVSQCRKNDSITIIIPSEVKKEFEESEIVLIAVNKLLRTYLRVFTELFYIAFIQRRYKKYINISNYGITTNANSYLYYHNPHVHLNSALFGMNGKANIIKHLLFKNALRKSKKVFVQSDLIKEQISSRYGFVTDRIIKHHYKVLIPTVGGSNKGGYYIYPSSGYDHKREDIFIQIAKNHRGLIQRFILLTPNRYHIEGLDDRLIIEDFKQRNEVIEFMANSNGLVFTSESETLGLPLLEAVSLELPVFCQNEKFSQEIGGNDFYYYERDDSIDDITSKFSHFEKVISSINYNVKYILNNKRVSIYEFLSMNT